MKTQINLIVPISVLLALVVTLALLGITNPGFLLVQGILPGAVGLILLSGIWILWVSYRAYIQPMQRLHRTTRAIVKGQPLGNHVSQLKGVARQTGETLGEVAGIVREAAAFAHDIGEGNYDTDSYQPATDNPLGTALLGMRAKLKEMGDEESRRTWMVSGFAEFSDLIQQPHANLEAFGHRFVAELCRYMELELGAMYLLDEETPEKAHLIGAYALDQEKLSGSEVELSGTVLQQAILDRKASTVNNLPEGYIDALSGLGGQAPRHLLICPVMTPDEVFGAVELASFHPIEAHKLEWLEKVCHDVAVKVGTIQRNAKTSALLQRTQESNARMREQEETMRKQAEALKQAQSEGQQQLDRLENEMALSKSLTQAIDRTNASLDLDLAGNILAVNDMFTSVMGYSAEELIGKNEMELLPVNDLQGGQYQMMWENLQTGTYFSGEFRRIRKDGGEVWFSGSYSPVYNAQGEVIRIAKFARVVSEEKEKSLLVKGQLNAVSHALSSFFLTPEQTMLSPNATFTKTSGYKRGELRKFTFNEFLADPAYAAQQWPADLQRLFTGGELLDLPLELQFQDGQTQRFRAVLSPIRLLSGRIEKAYVILLPQITSGPRPFVELEFLSER